MPSATESRDPSGGPEHRPSAASDAASPGRAQRAAAAAPAAAARATDGTAGYRDGHSCGQRASKAPWAPRSRPPGPPSGCHRLWARPGSSGSRGLPVVGRVRGVRRPAAGIESHLTVHPLAQDLLQLRDIDVHMAGVLHYVSLSSRFGASRSERAKPAGPSSRPTVEGTRLPLRGHGSAPMRANARSPAWRGGTQTECRASRGPTGLCPSSARFRMAVARSVSVRRRAAVGTSAGPPVKEPPGSARSSKRSMT